MDFISYEKNVEDINLVKKLERQLTKERAALAIARAERDAYHQELYESNRYAAWVSHERENLINAINRLTAEKKALMTSKSWRITAPLRKFIKTLQALKRI